MMPRACQRSLSALACLLVAWGALLAASDDCRDLAPDPHCPFCQIANLPMMAQAQAPQLAWPEMVEWSSAAFIAPKERECTFDFGSSRAPPA